MSRVPAYIRLLLFIATLLWFLGALLPFFIGTFPVLAYGLPFAHIFYSPVCHQLGSKLLCVDGACTLVCSRCIGIYAGFMLSALGILIFNPVKFKNIKYFLYSTIPMMLDVVLSSVEAYKYSPWIASFTGVVFGYAAFYYFYNGLFEFIAVRRGSKQNDEYKELS